jgi:hypothetical protein
VHFLKLTSNPLISSHFTQRFSDLNYYFQLLNVGLNCSFAKFLFNNPDVGYYFSTLSSVYSEHKLFLLLLICLNYGHFCKYRVWPACAAGMIITGLGIACVLGAGFVNGINTLM